MNTLTLDKIIPDANQPRKYFGIEKMTSLKESIKKHGIMTPVTVQKEGDSYLLVDGERRYRAAKELHLKEIPVNIIAPKDPFTRLLEQFHLQEQHEGWSPVEKAMAIMEIAKIAKKSLKEVCEMLSIPERTIRYYVAFGDLQNKEKFVEYQINLDNAEKIREIKNFARRTKEANDEPFTRAQENKMEKVLIDKIKSREIIERGDYSRIKDSFRMNPKLIDKFMNDDFDINATYVSSKAKGARYARNLVTSAAYVASYGAGFMDMRNVKLTDTDIATLKKAEKMCRSVINLVE